MWATLLLIAYRAPRAAALLVTVALISPVAAPLPSPCSLPYLPRRAGTELSPSWPGFYEGAIYTAEQAAATVDALLKGQKA